MEQLTPEDYKNILILMGEVRIKGSEATGMAILQQKITKLLEPKPEPSKVEEKK